MKISIDTIKHSDQAYETVGNYGGDYLDRWIKVSEFGSGDYNFIVALHELIEQHLCFKRGIKEEDITNFDKKFEEDRKVGLHTDYDEPGDDQNAPYRKEHFFATNIERLIAEQLGIDWSDYSQATDTLGIRKQQKYE